MKSLNARKGNSYKSQAALHGLQYDTKDPDAEPNLSDAQEKLIEERIAKLKKEKLGTK